MHKRAKLRQVVCDEEVVTLAESLDVGVVPRYSDIVDPHICSDVAPDDNPFILAEINHMDHLLVVLGIQGLNHQQVLVIRQRVVKQFKFEVALLGPDRVRKVALAELTIQIFPHVGHDHAGVLHRALLLEPSPQTLHMDKLR